MHFQGPWSNTNKVVAIIQARMGSRRLPGKVLRTIGGYTLLNHIVHRLRQVPLLDSVVLATTERREDDCIADHCRELDLLCLRGPEHDVLERYFQAATYCHARMVVRATGDNPVIDPGSVQRTIKALRAGGFDMVSEEGLPKGCCGEVFTYSALWKARESTVSPEHREHVTLVMKQDRAHFKVHYLEAPPGLCRSGISLSIDTEDDYAFVKTLMEGCSIDALKISVGDLLAALPLSETGLNLGVGRRLAGG